MAAPRRSHAHALQKVPHTSQNSLPPEGRSFPAVSRMKNLPTPIEKHQTSQTDKQHIFTPWPLLPQALLSLPMACWLAGHKQTLQYHQVCPPAKPVPRRPLSFAPHVSTSIGGLLGLLAQFPHHIAATADSQTVAAAPIAWCWWRRGGNLQPVIASSDILPPSLPPLSNFSLFLFPLL